MTQPYRYMGRRRAAGYGRSMAGGATPRLGQFQALGLKHRLSVLEAHLAAVEAWQRQSLARVQDLRARLADSTRQIDDYLGHQPGRLGYERVGEGDYVSSPSRRTQENGADTSAQSDESEAGDEDRDEGRDDESAPDAQQDEQRAESTTRRSSTSRARRSRP